MALSMPMLNPGIESASLRSQAVTLGMEASQQAAATGGTPAPDGTGAAAAVLGAEGVQPAPPSTMKTVLASTLRGALTGASLAFSLNKFAPGLVLTALHFIPPLKGVVAVGTVAALVGGAVIGGVLGFLGGMKTAKKQQADFNAAQAAQAAAAAAAAPPGEPLTVGPDGKPIGADPAAAAGAAPAAAAAPDASAAKKNPAMDPAFKSTKKRKAKGKSAGASAGAAGACSCAHCKGVRGGKKYNIKRGDTLGRLARTWGVSVSDIVAANPKIRNPNLIYAGDSLVKPAK